MSRKWDALLAIVFFSLLLIFFSAMYYYDAFFNWAFDRHQNTWSWYIRPLFLIPFCFFAYKRSLSGISFIILALFTSMFWFPKPEFVSEEVIQFLNFEKSWLATAWSIEKMLQTLSVPISLSLLALAFWKRSLWMGIGVMVLMATGKIIWSISSAGEAGKSILIPALTGLLICIVIVYIAMRKKS